ncbi:MAG: cellulase family glycosylhydrolase [Clostridiales bacterium]|nr:cellulase family glycosylhydrolase [Clostridiales bacterium]
MKKWRLTALSFICTAAMAFPVQAGTWIPEGDTWKYQQEDGTLAVNRWIQDTDGRWYYLDQNGVMVRNYITPDGYVTGRDGAYITGMWQDGDSPVTPWDYQQLLGRGMDVDWSKTKEGRKWYQAKAVEDFKAAGVDHVRIRVKDDLTPDILSSLDRQIEDCLSRGMIPILAYQADEFKNNPCQETIDKVTGWWRTAAEHFQTKSHMLAFDLMIESSDELNKQPEMLNQMIEQTVTAIRQSNPDRILIMSPRLRSDPMYLSELNIPTMANGYMMAEWHFYASGPSKTNERKKWTTGTDSERNLIQEKIGYALRWQEETGIPTWVGAWMPGNYNDENNYTLSEQMEFASFMCSSLEAAGIPFAVNSDTKFYDRENGVWLEAMAPLRQLIWADQPLT